MDNSFPDRSLILEQLAEEPMLPRSRQETGSHEGSDFGHSIPPDDRQAPGGSGGGHPCQTTATLGRIRQKLKTECRCLVQMCDY